MENEQVLLFRLFGRCADWLAHEETGSRLDVKESGEEDLLRKPSFLTYAGSTPSQAVDAAHLLGPTCQ